MKKKKQNPPVPVTGTELLPSMVFPPVSGTDYTPDKYNHFEPVLQISHINFIDKLIEYDNSLFTSSRDRICKWDIENAILNREFPHVSEDITTISIGCNFLFSGHEDGSVLQWDLKQYKVIHSYKDHSDVVLSLIYDQSDESIYSCSKDGMIVKYKINSKDLLYFIEPYEKEKSGFKNTIDSLGCLIYKDFLFTYSLSGKVKKYDKITGRFVCDLAEASSFITIKDNILICGSYRVSSWDLNTGLLIDKKYYETFIHFIKDNFPDKDGLIFCISDYDKLNFFNIKTLSVVPDINYETGYSIDSLVYHDNIIFFPDKNRIIGFDLSVKETVKVFSSANKFIRIIPLNLSGEQFQLYIIDGGSSVVSIPSNGKDPFNTMANARIVTDDQFIYIQEEDNDVIIKYNHEMEISDKIKIEASSLLLAATDNYLFYFNKSDHDEKRNFYKFNTGSRRIDGPFSGKGGISFLKIYNDYIYSIGSNAEAMGEKLYQFINDPWIREGAVGGVFILDENDIIIQRWHIESGEYNIVFRIIEYIGEIYGFEIIGNIAYISCEKYGIGLWDMNSGEYIQSLNCTYKHGFHLACNSDKKIIMAYNNNEVLFISSRSGDLICSFMMLNESDYTFYTEDNKFFCTNPNLLQVKDVKITPEGFEEQLITDSFIKYAKSLRFLADLDDIFKRIRKILD